MMNPTQNHLEEFSHMRQPTPTRESTKVDLGEPSLAKDVVMEQIEDYKTGSGTDEDDESPPPIQSTPICKVLTQSAKSTPAKAAIMAPTSQGGSSSKKA